MKITTRRDALFAQLQTVTRAASTRSAVQALSGVQLLARQGRDRAARHRHGDRPARPARGRGRPRGRRRAAGAPGRRRRPRAARRRGVARAAPGRAGRRDRRRLRDLPHPHAALGGLPAVPGAGGRPRPGPRRGVRRDRAQGRPLRLARRDAPGAHRHPRLRLGRRAADGRDRLLPALGQGDQARGAAGGRLRGQRAGAGAAGADADRPARERRRRSASPCAPTRSCSRPAASCSPRG